jgi:hypothetical protein
MASCSKRDKSSLLAASREEMGRQLAKRRQELNLNEIEEELPAKGAVRRKALINALQQVVVGCFTHIHTHSHSYSTLI